MRLETQARAQLDLIECLEYMEREAGVTVKQRFAESIEAAFAQISAFPAIGKALPVKRPRLAGLRYWNGVKGFPKYYIFYLVQWELDAIVIVRFGHGAQNWLDILESGGDENEGPKTESPKI